MGQDFGQLTEWNEQTSLDWRLLQHPHHANLHRFYQDLLHLYRSNPALYQEDQGWDSFQWIRSDDSRRSLYSFIRRSDNGKGCLLFVFNFTPMAYPSHRVGVPCPGQYRLILDETGLLTDERLCLTAEAIPQDDRPQSIAHPLSAYGIHVYRFDDSRQ